MEVVVSISPTITSYAPVADLPDEASGARISTSVPELVLEPLNPADGDVLFAALAEDEEHFRRFQDWPPITPEIARAMINDPGHQWSIWYRGQLVGWVLLTPNVMANGELSSLPPGDAALGYWIIRRHEGKGFVTTSCRAVIEHCVSRDGLRSVRSGADRDNESSLRVLRRLGFVETERTDRSVTFRLDLPFAID
ncbi:MAG: GNAT family N-acetyltransferase [Candidatus Dormibacteria bacterium]